MPVTQEEIRVPHASGVAAVTQVIEQLVASSARCSAASARWRLAGPGLRGAAHRRGEDQARDNPRPQAVHRARDLAAMARVRAAGHP